MVCYEHVSCQIQKVWNFCSWFENSKNLPTSGGFALQLPHSLTLEFFQKYRRVPIHGPTKCAKKVFQISNYLNEMSWSQIWPNFDLDKQILKKIQKNGKLVPTLLICNLLTHLNSKLGFWAWVVVTPSHTWLSGRSLNGIHPKSTLKWQFNPIQSYFWKIFCMLVHLTNTNNFAIYNFLSFHTKNWVSILLLQNSLRRAPVLWRRCHFPPPTRPATIFQRFPMVCYEHVSCQIQKVWNFCSWFENGKNLPTSGGFALQLPHSLTLDFFQKYRRVPIHGPTKCAKKVFQISNYLNEDFWLITVNTQKH